MAMSNNEWEDQIYDAYEGMEDDEQNYDGDECGEEEEQNYDDDECGEEEEQQSYDGDQWEEEQSYHGNNQHEQGSSRSGSSSSTLADLYAPPQQLMYQGDFHQTKFHASFLDRFLLVNVQATNEFSSHLLNRDVWSNVLLAETIKENLVFWQVSDDTVEGAKVKTYYNLLELPAILVLNPITGEKMKSWSGEGVDPETLLENLVEFMEKGPKEALLLLGSSRRSKIAAETEATEALEPKPSGEHDDDEEEEEEEKYPYLALPEEPEMGEGRNRMVCRVGLRFPEGQRLCRNFVRTDPIQLLWSWCRSELMCRDENRRFQLIVAIPGGVRRLHHESSLNLEEADLPNCLVSVVWV